MRPAFWNPSSTADHLSAAACRGDARLGRLAEGVRLDGERFAQLARAEHLHRRVGTQGHRLAEAGQAETAQRLALPLGMPDRARDECDRHRLLVCHAVPHALSSATALPRRAATWSAVCSSCKAAIVAFTMLC